MQPIKRLIEWLEKNSTVDHYLFTSSQLHSLLPELSALAFKTLLSRAVSNGHLIRVCRGLYMYKRYPHTSLLLFHAAAQLRANEFNYISLETALSDLGIISQIPLNYISIMSSGRSSTIACGKFGTIDFVHTTQEACDVASQLVYDDECRMWRAMPALALRDIKATRRSSDLIDWEIANELI